MKYITFLIVPLLSPVFLTPSQLPEPIQMLTTAYSEIDSCHYPTEEGCLVASGKIADHGMVACPRSLPLGTKIEIDGKDYTCEDRYNADLSDRIDIWFGYGESALTEARNYGRKVVNIRIIDPL